MIQILSDWTSVTRDPEGCPSYLAFQKPIQKSQQDDRDYRLIRLENGLHAMLVHDAKADKGAASLDVAVGNLSDPVSHPSSAIWDSDDIFIATLSFRN